MCQALSGSLVHLAPLQGVLAVHAACSPGFESAARIQVSLLSFSIRDCPE